MAPNFDPAQSRKENLRISMIFTINSKNRNKTNEVYTPTSR